MSVELISPPAPSSVGTAAPVRDCARESADLRRLFAGLVAVLLAVGIQMVHSASLTSMPGSADAAYVVRHLIYLTIAVTAGWLAAQIRPTFLEQHAGVLLRGLVVLLVAVMIPGVGTRVNGAQRWLRLANLSLQPSELGRIVLPIVAAAMIHERRRVGGCSLRQVLRLLLPLVFVLPLVAVEPDLGATLFLGGGYILALFLGGLPLRWFLGSVVLAAPAAASLLILRPYQLRRITGFMDAWRDLSQAPWQIRQSLLSLGSGGLHGTGVGSGWQKLSYLPEANTDFVFAVIGEELGLAGTMTICLLWMAVLVTGRSCLSRLKPGSFERTVGATLLLQLVFQALANIAVVTAMVPPKGVPHPFISYGGTNLLVSVISVGLIIGMSRHEHGADD